MTGDEGLELAEQLLAPKQLNKVQKLIFQHAWEGQSYKEIAEQFDYTLGHIKDTGSELWKVLSEVLNEKITRQNFKVVLKQIARQASQTVEVSQRTGSVVPNNSRLSTADQNPSATSIRSSSRCDWGEAIDVSVFYNRTAELATLSQWIRQDRCRLITLLGMGGIGKTSLSIKIAEQLQEDFEFLVWRSLRHAPTLPDLLSDLILTLSEQQEIKPADTIDSQITNLMKYLRRHRCLLILDNLESILQSGKCTGLYRQGYEGYGQLVSRIGDERHQSCLILTSRERPGGMLIREGDMSPVRSLQLEGLQPLEGQKILNAKGLQESDGNCQRLIQHYSGNPLALKIAAATISSLFAGNVVTFLSQGTVIFGDIGELLDQQFDRLSPLEQTVMYWLAISRETVTLEDLAEDIIPKVEQRDLLEALVSLQGRALIEANEAGFSQQPMIMEYMTERLVRQFYYALSSHELTFFNHYALIKAQAKDFIRAAQIRLILQPVKDKLLAAFETQQNLEVHLNHLLAALRREQPARNGYAAGNLLNLFWQLQSNLCDRDFSGLIIQQAYLANIVLHRTNFSNTDIRRSVFAETFGGVTCVAFSTDSKRLATSDTNGEIQVWATISGKQLLSIKGHTHWAWAVAFSPDGKCLASVSDDYQVKLWDATTGECVATLTGHTYSVNAVAFSPDGQLLATCGQDATVRLWNLQSTIYSFPASAAHSPSASADACVQVLEHTARVWSVAFSPDGETIASCAEDRTVKLWNVATGECLQTLTGHQDWVKSVAFSPDGRLLASGSFDHMLKVWDLQTGCCLKTLSGHTGTITTVAFSANGQLLASSSYDQTIKLWDVQTGRRCTKTLNGHQNRVWSIAFSPNGQFLSSGGDDHAAKFWNVETGRCTRTIKGHTNSVLAIALSPDRQYLAGGYEDQAVRIWHLSFEKAVQTLQGHKNRVWSVAFAPQPKHSSSSDTEVSSSEINLATGSADRTVKLWNWQTGQCLKTLEGHTSWVWSIAFSPEAQQLASGSYDRTVKLWDVDAGKCLKTLEGHSAPVVSVVYNWEGKWLASSSFDAQIKLWEVQSGRCLQTFEGHCNSVWQVAFSPDGQTLVSCSFDQTIKLWNINTGDCLQTFRGHAGPVATVAYSPDGRYLISGGLDQTIRRWDLATGECIQTIKGHKGLISSLLCEPTSPLLDSSTNTSAHINEAIAPQLSPIIYSASFDETIKTWTLDTGACVATLRAARPYEGMIIGQATGLSEAQKVTLKALGAVD